MKRLAVAAAALIAALATPARASQPACPALPRVEVAAGGHYLEAGGKPFFWLGDTAWELIHALPEDEAASYLSARARQGFSLIQTVVLSEFDGLTRPTPDGLLPFRNGDPSRPDPAYFDHVRRIVEMAACRGLYVALVPAWGDKLTAPWGAGPRIFRADNLPQARAYGRYVGQLLRDRTNVVWLLGGDRPARTGGMNNAYLEDLARKAGLPPDADFRPIWAAMAAGLEEGLGRRPLTIYHPQGGETSSSVTAPGAPWISVNGMQSGHGGGRDVPVWRWIARDYALTPAKPTIDLEPNYEDHPYNPWPQWDPATGWFDGYDVRRQVYRSVFAGACGVTYGNHSVWQFAGAPRAPQGFVRMGWIEALDEPGGRAMRHLADLMRSRPMTDRVPDDRLIAEGQGEGLHRMTAMRDAARSYAFIYVPTPLIQLGVDLRRLRGAKIHAWWYDTRSGVAQRAGEAAGGTIARFTAPPYGPDWVLVLDDGAAGYGPPGTQDLSR